MMDSRVVFAASLREVESYLRFAPFLILILTLDLSIHPKYIRINPKYIRINFSVPREKREDVMFSTIICFADMLLAALLVGAMFGMWLILNPAGLAAGVYITLQQQGIRTLNRAMPMLGAATVLLTILAAALGRNDSTRFGLLVGTIVCLLASGLITRFLNQPINAIVITWSTGAPPANWRDVRDKWWRWHLVRLFTGLRRIVPADCCDAASRLRGSVSAATETICVGAPVVSRESKWRMNMSAVTVINSFEVPAGREGEFFELWKEVNAYMERKPGYLGNKL